MATRMAAPTQEIITRAERLEEACAQWAACPVIGFDTEFVGEDTYHPELCLVQVAVPGQLYLIDPYEVGSLDPFWRLLHDPCRISVVHAGREEVRLCRLLSGAPPANLFDVQLAAGLVSTSYPLGHAAVVQIYLGQRLSKGETLTEWRRRPLTPEQIRYAYDDVRYLLKLHEKLSVRLAKLGRSDWIKEEGQRLIQRVGGVEPSVEEERWRKLRGVGGLDRRRLAQVRALFAWRDARAQAGNRPARTILRDDLLVEIVKRDPRVAADLSVVRGLNHRDLDEIVAVLHQAREVPLEDCPEVAERGVDSPQLALVSAILVAALGDFCHREQLALGLVGTSNDVRTLVRAALAGEPLPRMPLTEGWRARFVLPELLALLAGRRWLRIANPRSPSPLEYRPRDEPV
ncbi:MAG: HRDC domain-containing protein [Gemmataceae bacterium]